MLTIAPPPPPPALTTEDQNWLAILALMAEGGDLTGEEIDQIDALLAAELASEDVD
ncbi:hypothetical protein [Gloeobacter kilaueensis]|uniref:Uncharacterized protein n=1 Tax=Gloeobacter kilaueensis (strain ATCC BAA-2537 / CCAP 1431/1 / ULC 316 / JS1) TaxID=1183438 RepID=U5QDX7_GLOK1|nr:hypothetical protein [Gloeobacter kilaueensis]AGY57167.1 hypothetical protein GKIL_0921 [Gloeobacter kilaueensis JS1]